MIFSACNVTNGHYIHWLCCHPTAEHNKIKDTLFSVHTHLSNLDTREKLDSKKLVAQV